MSFPRYESYKDSGVEWLGQVPAHWKVISIKWMSPVLRGASPRPIDDPKYFDENGEYAWVRIADVSASDGFLKETPQKLSALGSSLSVKIAPGELFVSIAGSVGKPCISGIKACIHDGFVYFPRLKINPKLFYRIFESGTCYGGLGKWGTQLNLNTDTIGSIRVALPPQEELNHILAFLDRETAKIDALIAEQQRLIELLKEKRQAVISHAVTKGLNPDAPMKDSGIEWLGEVPAHWSYGTLTRVAERIVVGIAEAATHAYAEKGIPILRSTNIRPGKIIGEILFIDSDFAGDRQSKLINANDLVTVRTGNAGVTAVIPDTLDGCQCFTMLITTPSTKAVSEYLCFWMNSYPSQTYFSLEGWGTAQINISVPILKSLPVPIPSPDEQREIVEYLNRETTKLDTLTAEAQRGITLLKERRSALISAAVTGKIDVRGFADSLPHSHPA